MNARRRKSGSRANSPGQEGRIAPTERARLLSSLEMAEAMVRHDVGRETFVAFRDELGVFVRRAEGNIVRLADVYQTFEGCVVTHNHPNDTAFTPEDIGTACAGKVVKIRAVSNRY